MKGRSLIGLLAVAVLCIVLLSACMEQTGAVSDRNTAGTATTSSAIASDTTEAAGPSTTAVSEDASDSKTTASATATASKLSAEEQEKLKQELIDDINDLLEGE